VFAQQKREVFRVIMNIEGLAIAKQRLQKLCLTPTAKENPRSIDQ